MVSVVFAPVSVVPLAVSAVFVSVVPVVPGVVGVVAVPVDSSSLPLTTAAYLSGCSRDGVSSNVRLFLRSTFQPRPNALTYCW